MSVIALLNLAGDIDAWTFSPVAPVNDPEDATGMNFEYNVPADPLLTPPALLKKFGVGVNTDLTLIYLLLFKKSPVAFT